MDDRTDVCKMTGLVAMYDASITIQIECELVFGRVHHPDDYTKSVVRRHRTPVTAATTAY